MKIEKKFEEIRDGDMFCCESGECFIKVFGAPYNAANLVTGEASHFLEDALVIPMPNAKIVI